jgi:hypothetical protein
MMEDKEHFANKKIKSLHKKLDESSFAEKFLRIFWLLLIKKLKEQNI